MFSISRVFQVINCFVSKISGQTTSSDDLLHCQFAICIPLAFESLVVTPCRAGSSPIPDPQRGRCLVNDLEVFEEKKRLHASEARLNGGVHPLPWEYPCTSWGQPHCSCRRWSSKLIEDNFKRPAAASMLRRRCSWSKTGIIAAMLFGWLRCWGMLRHLIQTFVNCIRKTAWSFGVTPKLIPRIRATSKVNCTALVSWPRSLRGTHFFWAGNLLKFPNSTYRLFMCVYVICYFVLNSHLI